MSKRAWRISKTVITKALYALNSSYGKKMQSENSQGIAAGSSRWTMNFALINESRNLLQGRECLHIFLQHISHQVGIRIRGDTYDSELD